MAAGAVVSIGVEAETGRGVEAETGRGVEMEAARGGERELGVTGGGGDGQLSAGRNFASPCSFT